MLKLMCLAGFVHWKGIVVQRKIYTSQGGWVPLFGQCFEQMGEVVSRTWTRKEQVKFDEIVKHNSDSVGMNFWEAAFRSILSLKAEKIYQVTSSMSESDVDDVGSRFVKDITDSVEQHSKSYEKRYLKRSS
ncbi:hypothetical protein HPP92_018618 [Vanilla planifolia]|uniref:Uncharacterized protein n=1 Tax=Vanilla planifolia TaxID=51239 RepID=A0A835QES5_VANPL|nr:hypothetical protein HPP92_018618 [Vanilla planifolia]